MLHKKKETAKQRKRLENKKKKARAYLNIARLNDLDRQKQAEKMRNDSTSSTNEPLVKKIKIEPKTSENGTQLTPTGKPFLFGDDYERLKQELRERSKWLRKIPRFVLKPIGAVSCISVPVEDRIPLFLSDIQHLILYSVLENLTTFAPDRWCHIEKCSKLTTTVVIIIENLSLHHYTSNESCFANMNSLFGTKLEVITPTVYKGEVIDEIAALPITSTQKKLLIEDYGSLEQALASRKVFSMLKAVFPIKQRIQFQKELEKGLPASDKFPRTRLLLSASQLVQENYPVPLTGLLRNKYMGYVATKKVYEEVTQFSPMYAVDCEMCRTSVGENELTRISVVNENLEVCYETFVKPYNKIVDYLTTYSGITKSILQNVTTRLEDVQRDISELLPADAILIGQSLNMDLHSLRMMHPYVIDTSVIFNMTGDRVRKTKLKTLVQEFLDTEIQTGNTGHDSVEDSKACLQLVQLKLRNYIEFGDAVLSGSKGCLKNYRIEGDYYYSFSMLHQLTRTDKSVNLIAQKEALTKYKKFISEQEIKQTKKISCTENDDAESIIETITKDCDEHGTNIAHLRLSDEELEEDNLKETCTKVDGWVKQIWKNLPMNSLCVVVFGGEEGSNGASFVEVRREVMQYNYIKPTNK